MTNPESTLNAFLANQAFLRRLARELVGDPGRADDLVQDTWLAWSRQAPEQVSAPRAWLARTLRWRAGNQRRELERRVQRERSVARPEGAPDDVLETIEVQASVVAALRALDEPYRSTLVQRYFHDWTPTRIAGESGVSLNTVKARLSRGLQRLREDLDRRHGDRSAWCHLLIAALGRGGAGWGLTGGLTALVLSVARLGMRAATAFSSLGTWLALTGVMAAAFFAWMRWPRSEPELVASDPPVVHLVREAVPLADAGRVPVRGGEAAPEEVVAPRVEPGEPDPVPFLVDPLPFAWPQFGGTASHDALLLRERGNLIVRPALLWEASAEGGQPTILAGQIYSGGRLLQRFTLASFPEGLEFANPSPKGGFGPAPALTATLMLARVRETGGLRGFEREDLTEEWTWTPEEPVAADSPPCLVEDLVILALDREIVALRTFDGSPVWRTELPGEGRARATPASINGLVYTGTDVGDLVALDWATGEIVWTLPLEGRLGDSSPVTDGELVFVTGTSGPREANADLWAIGLGGSIAWQKNDRFLAPLSMPGLGTDLVFVVSPDAVAAFDREDGDALWSLEDDRFDAYAHRRRPGPPAPQPVTIGTEVLVALGDRVLALDQGTGERLYTLKLPEGERVSDLVHTGDRLYLASDRALRAIGNVEGMPVLEPGEVFELDPELRIEALRGRVSERDRIERRTRDYLMRLKKRR
jgi:RNA polymerase sigma factor (sigma-70 family)